MVRLDNFLCGAALAVATFSTNASAFDHSHQKWSAVLSRYRVAGDFKYGELKAKGTAGDEKDFKAYLNEISAVSVKEYDSFSRPQQMAFLINAYNALTVRFIETRYPIRSIKDAGGLFSSPWTIKFFELLGGAIKSLDPIEHEYLRPKFGDYRIHAAVNCASKSCPELRGEAFTADKLENQLNEQMGKWLGDSQRNRVDTKARVMYLSKIFDWYAKDFEAVDGGVKTVLTKHGSNTFKDAVADGYPIKYLDYDWGLNEPAG